MQNDEIFILPFSGIIALSTNSVDVSVETGIKISVIDVVDFVVVEEVVARKTSMHKSKQFNYIFKFLKLVVCIRKVQKLTGETWNTFGVLIQFFKISTAICFSDNIEVDKKGLHFIFVYVTFQIFGSEFC